MKWVVALAVALGGESALLESVTHAAQSANGNSQSFEVASVRLNKSGGLLFGAGVQTRPDGSAVAVNTPLRMLIAFAFGLDGVYRNLEGASTLLDERFDVIAKAGEAVSGVPQGQIGPVNVMMQGLLAERFKLAVRWEDRSQPGYALVRLKPDGSLGPRIQTTERNCSDRETYRQKPPGDPRSCMVTVINNELNAAGHRMLDISLYLSRELQRPVIDKTGLTGHYDIQMTFNATERLRERVGVPQPPEPSQLPSLFTALREQLGLKLEQQRVTIPVLVVEHVEPPSEN